MAKVATSIQEATRIVEVSPNLYVTPGNTEGQGGNRRVGFGGCTIGVGVRAACATVDTATFKLYSCLGYFLGPTNGFKPLYARVTPLRDTRTFVTRRIDLLQDQDDDDVDNNNNKKGDKKSGGSSGDGSVVGQLPMPAPTTTTAMPALPPPRPRRQRVVMTLTTDFMREEPRSLLEYSAPPRRDWSGPEESMSFDDAVEQVRAAGGVDEETIATTRLMYSTSFPKFERRSTPEGWYGQTSLNLLVPDRVPMDELPPTEKGTAEWYKLHEPCQNYVDIIAALTWILDNGIAHQVTYWSRLDQKEVAVATSLEFALRFFFNEYVWSEGYLLREETPREAGVGRTYKEALMRKADGSVLASMTQQCMLRARPSGKL